MLELLSIVPCKFYKCDNGCQKNRPKVKEKKAKGSVAGKSNISADKIMTPFGLSLTKPKFYTPTLQM